MASETTAPAAIVLRDVSFRYPGSRAAMSWPDLTIGQGEMVAVIGPNGSGKTTLLRLVSGILHPHGGQIQVCGVDPRRAARREFARKVAVVGPHLSVGFPFSVLEVVLMGRAPHLEGFRLESERDLEAARSAMDATGVLALAGRTFDSLSSGERQRVAVARALAQEPRVLLLDEPGAFLDIKQQTALYDLLVDLNQRDAVTIVSVLHDLNLASLYFTRVAMMKCGRLHAVGTPEQVLTYARVRDVFETDVYVDTNDLTGTLNILPLPRSRKA